MAATRGNLAVRVARSLSRHWVRSLLVVAGLLAAWLGVCAWEIARGASEVRAGAASLSEAKSLATAEGLTEELPLRPLDRARADFAAASSHLAWAFLDPLRVVPVLGRQLDSLRALSGAAGQAASVGSRTLVAVHALLPGARQAGPTRVVALRTLAGVASRADAQLARLDLGPGDGLVGPLASKRREFADDLGKLRSTLARTASAAGAGASLLEGPTTYLVLAANNAQMHAGSGMFLQVGTMTAQGGRLSLGTLTPSGFVTVPPVVPLTGDLARNWGFLHPNTEFENLALSPQFDVSARLAAQMWPAATGQRVDGVMAIDDVALQDLLSATGPVVADGVTIDSADALGYLLHDQYVGEADTSTSQRRERLGAIAQAVVQALEDRPVSVTALASALSHATAGRHLLLWSPSPAVERAWQATGTAGQLRADDLLVALVNRSGAKLDPYLEVDNRLTLHPHGAATDAVLQVTITNRTPPGQGQYIGGPFPGLGTVYGEYLGYLAVNLPGDARHALVQGYRTLVAAGPEGKTLLLAAQVDVLAGDRRTVTLTFELPGSSGQLQVVPSARYPAENWTIQRSHGSPEHVTDAAPHLVTW